MHTYRVVLSSSSSSSSSSISFSFFRFSLSLSLVRENSFNKLLNSFFYLSQSESTSPYSNMPQCSRLALSISPWMASRLSSEVCVYPTLNRDMRHKPEAARTPCTERSGRNCSGEYGFASFESFLALLDSSSLSSSTDHSVNVSSGRASTADDQA